MLATRDPDSYIRLLKGQVSVLVPDQAAVRGIFPVMHGSGFEARAGEYIS